MISFARDSNNDLFLNSKNDISMNTGLDACLQACESAVSTILGEKIYNQNDGIPAFNIIWNGVPNLAQARIAIIDTIQKVDNVIEVSNFDFVATDNEFKYTATIKTTFGLGNINNVI